VRSLVSSLDCDYVARPPLLTNFLVGRRLLARGQPCQVKRASSSQERSTTSTAVPRDATWYSRTPGRRKGIEIERLGSPCRDRATVRAREAVVLVGVERYGLRCRDLAEALRRSADQVSRWVGQASRRKAHDGAFRKRLDALDAAIASASIEA
jgi:hypothetical protein